MTEYLVIGEERIGLELDEYLCLLYPQANKGFLRRMIHEGKVQIDGQPTRPSHRLGVNQLVSIDFEPEELPAAPVAPVARVPILHEDDAVIVVDKPADLAVEPERWARDAACLSGALLAEAIERGEDGHDGGIHWRPRLVHRIDKDTTGCVLVAKNLEAERELRQAFESGDVSKHYLALVEGEYGLTEGLEEIDAPIGPDRRRTGRMQVVGDGKPAKTRVKAAESFRGFTLMSCEPLTGRTHQIRVHLAHEGFPLAVDSLYGRRDELKLSEIKRGYRPKRGGAETPLISRLTLHASRLEFPDVARGSGRMVVEAPIPKDLARTLKQLAKVRPLR